MSDDDHTGGYGRPPKQHQWPKGKSGNPKGRPPQEKGGLNPLDILDADVSVLMKGKKVKLSRSERRLRIQVQLALQKKNIPAMIYLIRELEKYDLLTAAFEQKLGGVIEIPSTMPAGMRRLLEGQYGLPPWSEKEVAWARRRYLAERSDAERKHDEFMRYPNL